MPWTAQELAVKDLLVEKRLSFEPHHIFELAPTIRLSVDFLVFVGPGLVLECTRCTKRRGSALAEIGRRCAFMDYRFGLLKSCYPKLRCGALAEAPNEDQFLLRELMVRVLVRSDFRSLSVGMLQEQLESATSGDAY